MGESGLTGGLAPPTDQTDEFSFVFHVYNFN